VVSNHSCSLTSFGSQPYEGGHPGRYGGEMSTHRPLLLVFDVNETLSDMTPLQSRFADVGAPKHLVVAWFAGLLRDGFALTASGDNEPFAQLAADGLRTTFHGVELNRGLEDAVQHVMDGLPTLGVHDDVVAGVRALAADGARMVTLSNGSTSIAEQLLEGAGIRGEFEALLTVEDAALWKPAPQAYAYALEKCAVDAADAMLIAAHPWDTHGAARAGLATAWVNRTGASYPTYFATADVTVSALTELADRLT
jgi:2-haloacid dehalogenase